MIRAEFAKYGEIKSIEAAMANADTQKTTTEGEDERVAVYVSYVKSKSAYQAFMAHRKHHKFPQEAVTILPADSWRQRDGQTKNNETENSIINQMHSEQQNPANVMDLNDMASRLSIQESVPSAPKCPQLHIDTELNVSLAQWRETVRNVKPDLEYILLKFPFKTNAASSQANCLSVQEYEKRLIETISANCVGEHFQALTISGRDSVSKEMLHWMAPALKALQSLIILNQFNSYILYALPELCPQVRMLRLTGIWDGDDCKDEEAQHWPSLKILILTHRFVNFKCDTNDGVKFRRFIELNPQLDILLLDGLIDDDLVQTIADNLQDLKVLKFSRMDYQKFDSVLDQLLKLNALRSISLTIDCAEQKDLTWISVAAKQLSQIQDMKLITLIQNYEPCVEIKETFSHLTGFPVTEHRHCDCHGKKRVLTFSGVIGDLEIPDELPVLVVVINTNSIRKSQDKSLEKDVLNVFDELKNIFSNVIKTEMLEDNEHTVFVNISSK